VRRRADVGAKRVQEAAAAAAVERKPACATMTDTVVCGVCAASGFLADKVSFFPFVVGVLLGCAMPSGFFEQARLGALRMMRHYRGRRDLDASADVGLSDFGSHRD
jgi:hypothetical protein